MYIPPSFVESDPEKLFSFMESHSFATIVSQRATELMASHLPLLIDRSSRPLGRLVGHFARANSHWELAANCPALVIFQGPHAYISPKWIEARNVVPTWNYLAVHAYGTLRLVDDPIRLREILQQTVQLYESNREDSWSISNPEPVFVERLAAAVVGFEIELQRVEGKWKLSQNHPPERREQIVRGLLSTGRQDDRQIADLMMPMETVNGVTGPVNNESERGST